MQGGVIVSVALLAHPATMSHKGLTPEKRLSLGITPNLFRFSVGIANSEDLIYALDRGLEAARKE
ncbi:MAG TPA: PLP-dependent transferase [Candidatus Nanoarchaeia archaeon]|nr:PLP-dependent transferase [Candidatus Nanoarchaeia archaeon]